MGLWLRKYKKSSNDHSFMELLINEINAGIICLDSSYNILFSNDRLSSLMNIQKADMTDKNILDLVPAEEKKQIEYILKNIRFSGSANFTLKLMNHYELKILECFGFYKKTDDRNIFILTINTSPKYHKNTKQLVNSQKFEILGRLTSGFAHDFNNLLAAAIGYITLIRTSAKLEGPNSDYLIKLDNVLSESAASLKKILLFTRSDIDEVKSFNLVEFIPQMLDFISNLIRPNIKIKMDLPEDVIIITSNPAKLEQVFINLIINARDAIEGPGKISITVHPKELTKRNPHYSPHLNPGKYCFVHIKDSGRGMSSQIMEKIFEPYFSTKKETGGSGLGLFIVHETLESLGGGIKINSQEGQGTECILAIPSLTAGLFVSRKTEKAEHISPGEIKVLIVEDEKEVSEVLVGMLSKMNIKSRVFDTAKKALKYLNKSRPDLVIMDFGLPDLSGKELFFQIKRKFQNLPLIVTTGYTEQELLQAIPSLKPELILAKPFHFERLKEVVQFSLKN